MYIQLHILSVQIYICIHTYYVGEHTSDGDSSRRVAYVRQPTTSLVGTAKPRGRYDLGGQQDEILNLKAKLCQYTRWVNVLFPNQPWLQPNHYFRVIPKELIKSASYLPLGPLQKTRNKILVVCVVYACMTPAWEVSLSPSFWNKHGASKVR